MRRATNWLVHLDRCEINEIQTELSGLTAPILSQRLKELRCHGLVDRTVAETLPPTTTYSLTDQGKQIATHLRKLNHSLNFTTEGMPTINLRTAPRHCLSVELKLSQTGV